MTTIAGALLLSAPAGAQAAQSGPSDGASVASVGLLAEGVGMRERPSIRVRRVQRVLARRGFSLGPPGVDGRFGPLTAAAVRRYQARNGLAADGIVGSDTRRALARLQARQRRASARRVQAREQERDRGADRTPASSPSPPAATPRPATAQPQRAAENGSSDGTALFVALAAVVLSLIAMMGAFRRRGGDRGNSPAGETNLAPIGRDLMLEGHSADPAVGDFRGFALASAVPATEGAGETRFLVDDPRKPAPVWVSSADVQRSTSDLPRNAPVIGYVTVPSGPSDREEAAYAEIEAACTEHGWELLEIVRDHENMRMLDRPGLSYALRQIAAGEAHALVVSDVRRLTRSLVDLGALLEWFRDAHATLIGLDLEIDTTSAQGDQVASTLIRLSEWERERIANRTRSGLARVKSEGHAAGRPSVADNPELLARIAGMRQSGMTLQGISDQLNDEGIPTLRGGLKWRPSSVQAALGYKRPHARNPKDHLPPTGARREHG